MAKVTEKLALKGKQPLFISDFSPPRGADLSWVREAESLDADFVCVAYNPGKSVRLDSAIAAYFIKGHCHKEVIFNLACRDMNRLAIQTHLLGASALGLENVVVLKGDDFARQDLNQTGTVTGFTPTELIRSIKSMNEGLDYKGRKLERPTNFCVGGVTDLGKGIEEEARLALKKGLSGADFILTQPIYDPQAAAKFLDSYKPASDEIAKAPVFFGVQILQEGGVIFSDVPVPIKDDLENGRPGTDIATEIIQQLIDIGLDAIYLIPPIRRGGARDYCAAQEVINSFR